MGVRLQGFFTCPCGKIHSYGGMSGTSRCPQCGRDLYTVAVQPTSVPARVVHARVNSLMGTWAKHESAPREACNNCSFEYTRGTEHNCGS